LPRSFVVRTGLDRYFWPGPARPEEAMAAVVELTIVVEDDQILFSQGNHGSGAPVVIEDGSIWLGPDTARAVRWSQDLGNTEIDDELDGYENVDGALLIALQRSGPTHDSLSWRAILGSTLVAAPTVAMPERMVVDMTQSSPDFAAPILWPAGLSWRIEDDRLVVEHDGVDLVLAPGDSDTLEPVSAALALSLIVSAPTARAEEIVSFPDVIEKEAGDVAITTTMMILWHGLLPVEVVE